MASSKDFLIRLFLEADVKDAEKAKKALKNIEDGLDKLSGAAQKASLMITAPLTAFGAMSIKAVADFEEQMARVAAVSNATEGELKALENQARELGATTRFSASDAAQAMNYLSMAGFKPSQTMAAMPSTLNLAAAAMLDMGTAADITSNILTGFALKTEDLGHVNDVLVKAFTSSNTDLKQLGEAMKYVAPVAASAGQSIESITAAIGALGNAGIQGSMAGTTLRKTLSTLMSPNKKVADTLKELGVNTRDSTGQMRPFIDILGDLATSGVSSAEIMEMFGDRAGPGMLALMEQGSEGIQKFSDALKDSAGTTERVAKMQEDTLAGAWREVESAYEELQISLMKAGVFDALKQILVVAQDLLNAFNKVSPSGKRLAVAIASVAAAAGPCLLAISKVAGGFIAFSRTIVTVNASLTAMTVGLNMTSFAAKALRTTIITTGVGALIVGLGYAINFVVEKLEGVSEQSPDFNKAMQNVAKGAKIANDEISNLQAAQEALADTETFADAKTIKRRKEELATENAIARIRKNRAESQLSSEEQLSKKLSEVESTKKEIASLEGSLNKTGVDRLSTLQKIKTNEEDLSSMLEEVAKLQKEANEEKEKKQRAAKEAAEHEYAATQRRLNLEILSAKASGNKNLIKSKERELKIAKAAFEIKKNEGLTEQAALEAAQERIALEEKAAAVATRRKMDDEILEARIVGLRAEGRKVEADAIELRKKAADYAESQNISFKEALAHLKKIDDLQNKTPEVKQTGKLGTTYSKMEREQAKVQKLLDSKNSSTVERGRRAQQKYEDKYGIELSDDVREYRGRDRKTGRLVNAKAGKEFRENQKISAEAYQKASGTTDANQSREIKEQKANPLSFSQSNPLSFSQSDPTSFSKKNAVDPKLDKALKGKENGTQKNAKDASKETTKEITEAIEKVEKEVVETKEILESIKNSVEVLAVKKA